MNLTKIKRSWRVLRAALAVLAREKKLLLFPVIASGAALIIMLFFILPLTFYPTGDGYFTAAHWQNLGAAAKDYLQTQGQAQAAAHKAGHNYYFSNPWSWPIFGLIYLLSMYVATYCNVAFYHEIMEALNGRPVNIRRGFAAAAARWKAIALWSLFAGLVGYLINAIEQRVGFLGKIICSFIGVAWSVASIFAIPTLVRDRETDNPVKVLRHSAATLRRTWGELVIGFVGVEFASLFLLLAVLGGVLASLYIVGSFSAHIHHLGFFWVPLVCLGVYFLVAFPLSWLSRAVNHIYRCALYIYATEGVIPDSFDQDMLDAAWKVK